MPNVLYNDISFQLQDYLDDILAKGILKRSLEILDLDANTVSSAQMKRAVDEHVLPSVRSFLSPRQYRELARTINKILRQSTW